MTSRQKGIWFFIGLIIIGLILKLYDVVFYTVDLQGIPKKEKFFHYTSTPDSGFTCQLTSINLADSLTLLNNLHLKPYLISNILKYRNKIKFFISEKDFLKVYGIEKIYPKIHHCIVFELPQKAKININSADSIELSHFLPHYLASRIFKYREKKGNFKNWQEIHTVYGLDSSHIFLIQHFCYLEPIENHKKNDKPFKKKNIFNLNLADSLQLEKLPRIGPKMAARIIKYRNLLPYFIDYAQLSEVYGMNDTIIDILKKNTFLEKPQNFQPYNLNELEYQALSKHPYIGKQNAKILVNYRNMHGNFRSWEDLKNIKELQLQKEVYLKQYFTLQ
ncbi:MAG: hypothetical protein KatS3mg035_1307 [Bacteroidia bacterium]|nr:MAG: hypothetical protein KatS3mg035_1307 [Bacteroidia bacterium]